jgi:zinc D-Ala-D-Ala dipeptidase
MKKTIFLLFFCVSIFSYSQNLAKGFVYLNDIDPTIQSELRYIAANNFIGKPIDGYINNTLIVSEPAAEALKKIQEKLTEFGLSLKIFDAYRPQQAVDHFVRWAKVLNDTLMKQQYYPKVPKNRLFELGYISEKSGHTRGSTLDLTIVDVATNTELDMGSPYDFFGEQSHALNDKISKKQRANRLLLRNLMLTNGFKPIKSEWWHFTLIDEPFPETYFNFPIK